MPLYDFACAAGHPDYEVRCSIADKDTVPHPCPECGAPGRSVILAAPALNNPNVAVLSYPGSKKLRAGYVHSHGDKPATRTTSGYGGVVQGQTKRHAHPIAAQVVPERTRKP